ncbi:hypothetical protein ACFV29_06935 [Streptomyces sp. NPDC059690]|uniref:hypothetical protein n=1 Tax=Streptomyces sp. NPDC059690 TaxID=3346907 RepID=UPI0036B8FBBC
MSGTLGSRTGHRVRALVVTAEHTLNDALPAPAARRGDDPFAGGRRRVARHAVRPARDGR